MGALRKAALAAVMISAGPALAQGGTQTAQSGQPVQTARSESGRPVLTLDEALRQAAEQNLDLKAAQARLDQARTASRKVWANYLPQLSVGGSYNWNSTEATLAMPTAYFIRDVGEPQGPPFDPSRPPGVDNPPGAPTSLVQVPAQVVELEVQKQHQLGAQVQLSQALLAPALWPAIDQAYLSIELAELNVENARREILFGVVQLYYGAEALREAIGVQERLLESNRAHERDAQLKFEQGVVPRVALLRAQIDRARAEQDVVRTKNSYLSALSSLATLLDREPDFEVTRPPAPAVPGDAASLEAQALQDRPDLLAARKNVELAQKGRTGRIYSYLPSIGLTARYQLSNTRGFTGSYGTFTAGLGLNWVLWDGGLREADLREAGARIVQTQAEARAAENRVRDELRRAQLELESAEANRVKADEQARLAVENAELVQKSFEAGVATYLEVTDANVARRSAELSRVNEQLNAELAALRLARAAGLFNP